MFCADFITTAARFYTVQTRKAKAKIQKKTQSL